MAVNKEGDGINYELSFYRDIPFSVNEETDNKYSDETPIPGHTKMLTNNLLVFHPC
jgi:hypothetical protein